MRRKCSRRQRPWQQPLPPADKACTVWCKFALEAYADCLRQELAPHGMAVSIVQPGAVATDIGDNGHAGSVRRLQATDPPFADASAGVLAAMNAPAATRPEEAESASNRHKSPPHGTRGCGRCCAAGAV